MTRCCIINFVLCILLKVKVRLVATQNSFHFFDRSLIPVKIYEDKDEWEVGECHLYFKMYESFMIYSLSIVISLL